MTTTYNKSSPKPTHRLSIGDNNPHSNRKMSCSDVPSTAAARQLLEVVLCLMNQQQRWYADMMLLSSSDRQRQQHEMLGILQAVLQRCCQLQAREEGARDKDDDAVCLQHQFLLSCENDSGYTALHQAIYSADLCQILFLLRHAAAADSDTDSSSATPRLTRRPMELLYSTNNNSSTKSDSLIQAMVTATDHEGMTPAALLASQQRCDLAACRMFLSQVKAHQQQCARSNSLRQTSSSLSTSSFSAVENEQNEFDLLSRAMMRATQPDGDDEASTSSSSHDDDDDNNNNSDRRSESEVTYACEVFTFGRAHHCALGVVASNRHHHGAESETAVQQQQLRPQRVQAFAQDTVGRSGSAVAVASATHHTLTATTSGKLYAFGLGKGGRLGTGDEKPCATPVRVGGPLMRQVVIAVAAAENHSLCVAASGFVYAWGSNRFGQLGGTTSTESSSARCLPRRVDDLKHVVCVSVAAGTKHSVALSQHGEVYVWGDNGAGQLGFSGRSSSSNNSLHKVQRVEALWKAANGPKKAIAIAASERSTLILTLGSGQRSLPVNSIYSWGHGSHVPCKVQFDTAKSSRPINPVAIACARYHNAAITSDGHVFTWGLHADSLGTSSRNNRNRSNSGSNSFAVNASLTAPQLVTGMLPENGGGVAVAVSASENHTAVVTDTGDLFTWGDTFKLNILGHEGVRWQPDPKRVPGVHRAVGVSAAKEHIVLLIGTVFPPRCPSPASLSEMSIMSLEDLAAKRIIEHVDMFNVIPILTMAERTQTSCLLTYCKDFVRRNLDGVLNVSQKSVMNCFLNEQLVGSTISINGDEEGRDGRCHPFIADVVLAGSAQKPLLGNEILCDVDDWLAACEVLCGQPAVARMIDRFSTHSNELQKCKEKASRTRKGRLRTSSLSEISACSESSDGSRPHKDSLCSERCEVLTSNMDISSKDLAEGKLACLSKEVRAIRKRLGQIAKLEDSVDDTLQLTTDQQRKIARRPQLEADLLIFEPAIEAVEMKLQKLSLAENNAEAKRPNRDCSIKKMPPLEDPNKDKLPEKTDQCSGDTKGIPLSALALKCDVCQITCPDRKSHELHLNGRKHRNRIAQIADEKKKQVAASMIEEQQRQLLLSPPTVPQTARSKLSVSPWNTNDQRHSTQPKYKLPPPPHPVQETVPALQRNSAGSPAAKSLREIMAEEWQQSSLGPRVVRKAPLQLPAGSAPPLKCPPWSTSPFLVNVAPDSLLQPQKSTLSLGDYMPISSPNVAAPRPAGWSSPKAAVCRKAAASSLSFRDIQQQEQEFKEKEDHTYGANGSWFIERRERAGSLKEIQSRTAQEIEEQRFIEEQMKIEQQIYEELAAKQAEEKKRETPKHQNSRGKNNYDTGNFRRRKSRGSKSSIAETIGKDKERKTTEGTVESGGSSHPKRHSRRRNGPTTAEKKSEQSFRHRKNPPAGGS